ncbi:MAG: hypothetical protein R3E64_01765 [Halioglobus sp.]
MIGILLTILTVPSFASDIKERQFITKGMTESEVLLKIGKPDNESEVSGGGAEVVQKVWSYFPTNQDSQTLTTITIRNGIVVSVEGTIYRK